MWIDQTNKFTEDEIRALIWESTDVGENFEDIENEDKILGSELASSWMDVEMNKRRTRSRLWSGLITIQKDIDELSELSDTDVTDYTKYSLDEYHDTDLETETNENENTEQNHEPLLTRKRRHKMQRDKTFDHLKNFVDNFQQSFSIDTENELKHDTIGIVKYLYGCMKNHIKPMRTVINNLSTDKLILQQRGIRNLEMKLIAESIECNTTVTWFDLSYNSLEMEGLVSLAKALKENMFIKTLILNGVKLHANGYTVIHEALSQNNSIKYLDLSRCNLGDNSCTLLANLMKRNRILKILYLAHNQIGSDGAEQLGDAISSNDTMEHLDLSWNCITSKGAISIAQGLKENIRLKSCNLAWNGFRGKSINELSNLIKENSTLNELNLQHNSIDDQGIDLLGQAIISTNLEDTNLKLLDLSWNPISTKGMLAILNRLNHAQSLKLEQLIMQDIPVNLECLKLIDSIHERLPTLVIIHGTQLIVGNTQDDIHSEMGIFADLLFLLKNRISYNGIILTDLLMKYDVDKKGSVTIEEFTEALSNLGVNYKQSQLIELTQRLDKYSNGTIYYKNFIQNFNSNDENSYESKNECEDQ